MFEIVSRVDRARPVHHDTLLVEGRHVVLADPQSPLFGEYGVITAVGHCPLLGEVITIELTDRGTRGSFSRTEFRLVVS